MKPTLKKCEYDGCGKEFITQSGRALYCPECRKKKILDNARSKNERRRSLRVAKEEAEQRPEVESISSVAKKARAAGMTYGQYVARYGGQE